MTEGALKAAVLAALAPLEAMGRCKVERLQSGARGGGRMRLCKPGTPDLLVLLPHGESVWLELKSPGLTKARASQGKTRIAQQQWHATAAKLGHRVHIVTSVQDAISAVLP